VCGAGEGEKKEKDSYKLGRRKGKQKVGLSGCFTPVS